MHDTRLNGHVSRRNRSEVSPILIKADKLFFPCLQQTEDPNKQNKTVWPEKQAKTSSIFRSVNAACWFCLLLDAVPQNKESSHSHELALTHSVEIGNERDLRNAQQTLRINPTSTVKTLSFAYSNSQELFGVTLGYGLVRESTRSSHKAA